MIIPSVLVKLFEDLGYDLGHHELPWPSLTFINDSSEVFDTLHTILFAD